MTTTVNASDYPLPRERNLILGSLLALAAAAWGVLIWQSTVMDSEMSLAMGMGAPLFIALWIVMMVAIMFPTAAPMMLMFNRIHNQRRARGQSFVPTWIFVAAYLLVWSATGIVAYALAVLGDELADQSMWLMDNAARIGGGVLIAAGIYQLSPLKSICLNKCRSPISFVLHSWRDGPWGSFRMGLEHGVYCLGCCWPLFVILFPLGMMNIAVLAGVTALIFAEKSTAWGRQIARAAAVALVVYGAVVAVVPDALPMMMDDSSMAAETMDSDGGMEEDEAGGNDGGGGMDPMP